MKKVFITRNIPEEKIIPWIRYLREVSSQNIEYDSFLGEIILKTDGSTACAEFYIYQSKPIHDHILYDYLVALNICQEDIEKIIEEIWLSNFIYWHREIDES